MSTIQELAAIAYKSLEWKTRPNGDEYITRKDDAPAWLEDVCYAAHDGMFPDDYKYEFIKAAVDAIMDDEDPDEALDSDVDVYTGRLTAWLASSTSRMGYVDDGVDEYGWSSLDQALKVGQLAERREVYDAVYSALEDLASESAEEEAEALA